MKKFFISLLAVAATVNVMAIDYSAKAKITLTTPNGESCDFTIGESAYPSISNYNAPMNMTNREVAMYAINGSEKYQIFYTADIEGLALGLLTNTETSYTVTFSNLNGETQLYLVDAVADKYIEITEGGSYAFTAEANKTVADRFSITKYPPYTFINNVLVVGEAVTGSDVIVTPFTYDPRGKALGTPVTYTAPVNQVLTGGYFLVTYTTKGGAEREFIVNANPTVTPAN